MNDSNASKQARNLYRQKISSELEAMDGRRRQPFLFSNARKNTGPAVSSLVLGAAALITPEMTIIQNI